MDLIITILPVVTKDLLISPRFTPYDFLSRCKFSTLTTRQPMVGFYLLTFPRFPLRKKEHKSYFGKNRTHDFRTSRCAGYPWLAFRVFVLALYITFLHLLRRRSTFLERHQPPAPSASAKDEESRAHECDAQSSRMLIPETIGKAS